MTTKSQTWYEMKMAASGKEADIYVYDYIGYYGVSAKDFAKSLKALDGVKTINLHINSPGGNVFDGVAIYNLLLAHDADINTTVEGLAASMGSVIALAGSRISIAENAFFMIHNPKGAAYGEEKDMEKMKGLLAKIKTTMANLYTSKSSLTEEEVAAAMDEETWYTGSEAFAAGFCDECTGSVDLAASFDLKDFSNVPDALKQTLQASVQPAFDLPKTPPAVAGINHKPEAVMSQQKKVPATDDNLEAGSNKEVEVAAKAAALSAEKDRRKAINSTFTDFVQDHGTLLASCLDDMDCSESDASTKLLDAIGKSKQPTQEGPIYMREGVGVQRLLADAENAILVRAGLEAKATDKNGLMGYTLFEMARMMLESRSFSTAGLSKMDLVAAAFTHTSSDFATVLSGGANKAMLKGFEEADEVFGRFTSAGNLPDFKSLQRVDIGTFPSLRKVREGGEFKHISLGERAESAVLATYGELFSITRQAIINDDLGAFTRIPRKMGGAAIRTVGDLVFSLLIDNPTMADGVALFHANHGNLGAAGVINTANLDAARVLMGLQKDGAANLNIRPKFLICGIADQGSAKVAVEAEFEVDGAAKNSRIPNSVRGIAEVVSDARVDAADAWFLSGDAMMHDALEVLYLDGNNQPTLEQQSGWNVDGTEFKVRIDAAAKAWDYRALTKTPKS